MLTNQIARNCMVLLLAIAAGLSLLPGDNADAQEEIDVAGHWIVSFGHVQSCLLWIERDEEVLSGAIACHRIGLGKDLEGMIDTSGSFSFSANFGGLAYNFVGSPHDELPTLVGDWTADFSTADRHFSGTFVAEPDYIGWGNLNCDATVSSLDALLVLQAYYRTPCRSRSGLITLEHLNIFAMGGDVNLDGLRDSADALLILQFEAGLLESLPVR